MRRHDWMLSAGSSVWGRVARLSTLLAVLLAALLLPPAGLAGPPPESSERVYLALGNSLAVGVGATREDVVGYVPRLAQFFRGQAHGGVRELVNLAKGGITSATFISEGQLEAAERAIQADSDVAVVTLDVGGNDLLGLLSEGGPCAADPTAGGCQAAIAAALESFPANYSTILTRLGAALEADTGPEEVLVATFYNPYSGTGSRFEQATNLALLGADQQIDCGGSAEEQELGLNDLIACLAPSWVTVVDVYPLFVGKGAALTHINEEDIHPTNAGYAVIANAFRRAFLEAG